MKKPGKRPDRLVIGLTGGFGTGKTTVAAMLRGFGARVIDADAVGRELLAPGTRIHAAVARRFGRRILRPRSGAVDRAALARIVFNSDAQLRLLNNIMHPAILKIVKHRIAAIKKGVIVVDAPLLVETGFHRHVDRLVVVTASRNNQIKRVQSSRRLSKAAALRRIHSQIPLQDKVRMADFVIDNNGTRKDLRRKAAELRRMWWIS